MLCNFSRGELKRCLHRRTRFVQVQHGFIGVRHELLATAARLALLMLQFLRPLFYFPRRLRMPRLLIIATRFSIMGPVPRLILTLLPRQLRRAPSMSRLLIIATRFSIMGPEPR